jgi:Tol biopolymer transport system component
VAIKVLPEAVAQDPDRLARFEREAKAVAKLAHPNVLEIWDFGREGDVTYAVTELLEGDTLRDELVRGAMPWKRAREVGAAVADGLAAAHDRGVIHRDLKPENIFITSDGRVKILDFGLARLEGPVSTEADTGTLTPADTQRGVVIGTLGYMSPEQVTGKSADHRSDIFSLGCVLYEMLTGRRAFVRDSAAETMSAILNEDPPSFSASGVTVGPELSRTIERCLEKKPERRFQSVADLAFALRAIVSDTDVARGVRAVAVDSVLRSRRFWVVAAAIAVAAVMAGWLYLSLSRPDLPPPRTVALTSSAGAEYEPALSPDGDMVVYTRLSVEGPELYVKLIGGGEPLLIGHGWSSAWSPDGRSIAFMRDSEGDDNGLVRGMFVTSALGGEERLVARSIAGSHASGLSWSPDGEMLAIVDRASQTDVDAIFLLSLETGEKTRLTAPPSGIDGDSYPRFSPDGRSVAFVRGQTIGESDVFLVSIDGGEPRRLTYGNRATWGLDWTADGRAIVFSAFATGRAGAFSLWRVSVSGGKTEPLEVGEEGGEPSISRAGHRLAYVVSPQSREDLWRVAGPASQEDGEPAVRFISSAKYDNFPQYSPDGQRILFGSFRSGNDEIWICDSDGSSPRQLTHFGILLTVLGAWSPDGRQIAFSTPKEGSEDIYVVDAGGGASRAASPPTRLKRLPRGGRTTGCRCTSARTGPAGTSCTRCQPTVGMQFN